MRKKIHLSLKKKLSCWDHLFEDFTEFNLSGGTSVYSTHLPQTCSSCFDKNKLGSKWTVLLIKL